MVKYIDNDELAEIIKSDKAPLKDYIVIDVRDDDYRGGNIKGAQNSPSALFHANVDELVKSTKNVPTVVFHCMLSQQRGPKAAQIYSETRNALEAKANDIPHEVFVLRGGFGDFQAKFKASEAYPNYEHYILKESQDDPKLVENYDPKVWKAGYF